MIAKNGHEWKTLNDNLYVGRKKVVAVYAGNKKIYPIGSRVLQFTRSRQAIYRPGDIFSLSEYTVSFTEDGGNSSDVTNSCTYFIGYSLDDKVLISNGYEFPNKNATFHSNNTVYSSGTLLATLNGRQFYKMYDGDAITFVYHNSHVDWRGPILVSTKRESIGYNPPGYQTISEMNTPYDIGVTNKKLFAKYTNGMVAETNVSIAKYTWYGSGHWFWFTYGENTNGIATPLYDSIGNDYSIMNALVASNAYILDGDGNIDWSSSEILNG